MGGGPADANWMSGAPSCAVPRGGGGVVRGHGVGSKRDRAGAVVGLNENIMMDECVCTAFCRADTGTPWGDMMKL